jgi:hypothetical protein
LLVVNWTYLLGTTGADLTKIQEVQLRAEDLLGRTTERAVCKLQLGSIGLFVARRGKAHKIYRK